MLQKAIHCGVSLPSPSATVTTSRMPLSLETACVETSLLVVPGDLASSTVTPAFSHLPFPPCRASGRWTIGGAASLSTCITIVERGRDWMNGPRTLLSVGPRYLSVAGLPCLRVDGTDWTPAGTGRLCRWSAGGAPSPRRLCGSPALRVRASLRRRGSARASSRPGGPCRLVLATRVARPACTCGCLSVRARSASGPHRSSIGLS